MGLSETLDSNPNPFDGNTSKTRLLYIAGLEAQRRYRDPKKVLRAAPKVKLLIQPAMLPFLPVELIGESVGDLVTSYSYEKDRTSPGGTFTVNIVADDERIIDESIISGAYPINNIWRALGKSIWDVFKPPSTGILILEGYHVMAGFMRSMNKSVSPGGRREYVLRFDETGSWYNQSVLSPKLSIFGSNKNLRNSGDAITTGVFGSITGQPLGTAIQSLSNAFIGDSLAQGKSLFSAGTTYHRDPGSLLPLASRMIAFSPPFGGISQKSHMAQMLADKSMVNQAGLNGSTFWEYIRSFTPEPFVEMWCESGGRTRCVQRFTNPTSTAGQVIQAASSAGSALLGIPIPIPGVNVTAMLPGFNYMIIRSTPFDNPMLGITPWEPVLYSRGLGVFDLILAGDYTIITDDDIMSKSLGVSDTQQYTGFEVTLRGQQSARDTPTSRPSYAYGPLNRLAPGGRKSFGTRIAEYQINATTTHWKGIAAQAVQKPEEQFGIVAPLSTLANVWYRNQSKFKEGSFTVRSQPWARPGDVCMYLPRFGDKAQVVDDPREIGTYYIDSVSGSGQVGGNSSTTLNVIRGTPLPLQASNLALLLLDWEFTLTEPNI